MNEREAPKEMRAPFKGLGYQGRYEDEFDGLQPVENAQNQWVSNALVVVCIVLVVGVLAVVRG